MGDGTTISKDTPVPVDGLNNVISISAGGTHTAAIDSSMSVYVWGSNAELQLGIDNKISTEILNVKGITNASDVNAGRYHSIALTEDGKVKTWGYNNYGQLGDGTNINRDAPIEVSGLTDVKAIGAGYYHSLAVKEDGTVSAWGNNSFGQLGDGTQSTRFAPVTVEGLDDVTSVAAGIYYSLALKSDGTVYAWGRNDVGQLGDGTTEDKTVPVQVQGLSGVKAIACGYNSSFAVKENGEVYAWGSNQNKKLGDETVGDCSIPVKINVESTQLVKAGLYHAAALTESGEVISWGYNDFWQLGYDRNTAIKSMEKIEGLADIESIAAGENYCLAVKSNGTVIGWGENTKGQTGNGIYSPKELPAEIVGLTNVTAVAAGYSHSLALKSDGTIVSWGNNGSGQLGDGGRLVRVVPYLISEKENTDNTSKENAQLIFLGEPVTGTMNFSNNSHWYKLKLKYKNKCVCDITQGYVMRIFDKNGSFVNEDLDNSTCILPEGYSEFYINIFKINPSAASADYTLIVTEIPAEETKVTVQGNEDTIIPMNVFVKDMQSLYNKEFFIRYNPEELELIDLCKYNNVIDLTEGKISGTDIEILSLNEGEIVFKFNYDILKNKSFSCLVNTIDFKKMCDGESEITYFYKELND